MISSNSVVEATGERRSGEPWRAQERRAVWGEDERSAADNGENDGALPSVR
jgi:hypothetical protein